MRITLYYWIVRKVQSRSVLDTPLTNIKPVEYTFRDCRKGMAVLKVIRQISDGKTSFTFENVSRKLKSIAYAYIPIKYPD